MCVDALAHMVGVTQSAVSRHLRVLRQAGLVRGLREEVKAVEGRIAELKGEKEH